MLTFFCD